MNFKQAAEEIRLFSRGYAPVANLAVNTICNQRCLICQGWRMKGEDESRKLTLDEIKDLVSHLAVELHVKRFRITSAEPLLRPDLPDIIRCIRQFAACSVLTNGMAMTAEMAGKLIHAGVSKVRFSIDAPNDVNDKLRGVDSSWERSRRGVLNLLRAREQSGGPCPKIEIFSVLTRLNIEHIPDMYRFVNEQGLDALSLGILWETSQKAVDETTWKGKAAASGHMVPQGSSLKPTRQQVFELRNDLVRRKASTRSIEWTRRLIEHIIRNLDGKLNSYRCPYQFFINIDSLGNLVPCPLMTGCSFGNIRDKKARDIWLGREHYEFLARVKREPFPVCHEMCDAKHELFTASIKSEMRDLATALLHPLHLRSLRRSAGQ